jgi:hypothetical protein
MPRTRKRLETGEQFCRQCKGDYIGPPGELRCGTCGLPFDETAAKPEPERLTRLGFEEDEVPAPAPVAMVAAKPARKR